MTDNFEKAVDIVLKFEGGYSNNPLDSGGETKYGISKSAYPYLDIATLTLEKAKAIYYNDYWLRSGAALLPWPLSLIHFDTAVNMGVSRAKSFLDKTQDPSSYLELRKDYYYKIGNRTFIGGWINRITALQAYVLAPALIVIALVVFFLIFLWGFKNK